MQRPYVTVDVFTDRAFGGNPLAVVLDGNGLTTAEMQAIATEFNYSETTFVLPPRDASHTAQVRIFTSRVEVPFAGHPMVGTAVVLARELEAQGGPRRDQLLFETAGGLVPLKILRERESVVGAEFSAPQALRIGSPLAPADAAACLSLESAAIDVSVHPPQVLSVGLPFLVVAVTDRQLLRAAKPDVAAQAKLLPPLGTDSVYAYCRGATAQELHARMFSPLDNTIEDPATGSATAATIALLASLLPVARADTDWRVEQGVDMGRPSLLRGRTERRQGLVSAVHLGGHAVCVMRGEIHLPDR
jgi:trans-2,3-dihydro-3-hydroxyanthranilate isomerase